jgi:hypothetical protein
MVEQFLMRMSGEGHCCPVHSGVTSTRGNSQQETVAEPRGWAVFNKSWSRFLTQRQCILTDAIHCLLQSLQVNVEISHIPSMTVRICSGRGARRRGMPSRRLLFSASFKLGYKWKPRFEVRKTLKPIVPCLFHCHEETKNTLRLLMLKSWTSNARLFRNAADNCDLGVIIASYYCLIRHCFWRLTE